MRAQRVAEFLSALVVRQQMAVIEAEHRKHTWLDDDDVSARIEILLQSRGRAPSLPRGRRNHALRKCRAPIRRSRADDNVDTDCFEYIERGQSALRRAVVGEHVGEEHGLVPRGARGRGAARSGSGGGRRFPPLALFSCGDESRGGERRHCAPPVESDEFFEQRARETKPIYGVHQRCERRTNFSGQIVAAEEKFLQRCARVVRRRTREHAFHSLRRR